MLLTYTDEKSTHPTEIKKQNVVEVINYIMNIVFIIESILKSISLGVIVCPTSYLRDYWNILDFAIAYISIIDMAFTSINLPVVKV